MQHASQEKCIHQKQLIQLTVPLEFTSRLIACSNFLGSHMHHFKGLKGFQWFDFFCGTTNNLVQPVAYIDYKVSDWYILFRRSNPPLLSTQNMHGSTLASLALLSGQETRLQLAWHDNNQSPQRGCKLCVRTHQHLLPSFILQQDFSNIPYARIEMKRKKQVKA